jgi:type I restriction enzyme, S subunit
VSELPKLPTGWTWAKVRDVGQVKLGRQRSPEHHSGKHMRPYLRVANVYDARIDLSDVMEMNFTPEEYETFRLQPGDVLLNEGQSLEWVGRAAIYRGEPKGACFQNTLIRFRAGPRVLPEFALLVFRHYVYSQRFRQIARWTTNIAHLGSDRFAEVEFPVPPLRDQERIVACTDEQFTRLDAGVAALERLRAHLRRYRAALLKAAVEGGLSSARTPGTSAGSTRDSRRIQELLEARRRMWEATSRPGERTRKYREPGAPRQDTDVPSGWALTTVGQTCFVDVGFAFKSADFVEEGEGVRLLRGENIEPGSLRWVDTRCLPEVKARGYEHLHVAVGDIILAMDRPVVSAGLKLARAKPDDVPCLLVQRVARIRPVDARLGEFVYAVLQSPESIKHLLAGQTGTQLPHISGSGIESLTFGLPPDLERDAVVRELEGRLSVIEAAATAITRGLARAARLRASILRAAFEGRLVAPEQPARAPAA